MICSGTNISIELWQRGSRRRCDGGRHDDVFQTVADRHTAMANIVDRLLKWNEVRSTEDPIASFEVDTVGRLRRITENDDGANERPGTCAWTMHPLGMCGGNDNVKKGCKLGSVMDFEY